MQGFEEVKQALQIALVIGPIALVAYVLVIRVFLKRNPANATGRARG